MRPTSRYFGISFICSLIEFLKEVRTLFDTYKILAKTFIVLADGNIVFAIADVEEAFCNVRLGTIVPIVQRKLISWSASVSWILHAEELFNTPQIHALSSLSTVFCHPVSRPKIQKGYLSN